MSKESVCLTWFKFCRLYSVSDITSVSLWSFFFLMYWLNISFTKWKGAFHKNVPNILFFFGVHSLAFYLKLYILWKPKQYHAYSCPLLLDSNSPSLGPYLSLESHYGTHWLVPTGLCQLDLTKSFPHIRFQFVCVSSWLLISIHTMPQHLRSH